MRKKKEFNEERKLLEYSHIRRTIIKELKEKLEIERAYLQEEIKLEYNYENIIGQSDGLNYVLYKVEQISPSDTTVLVLGETGTGKELVARAIHGLLEQTNWKVRGKNGAAEILGLNRSTLRARLRKLGIHQP